MAASQASPIRPVAPGAAAGIPRVIESQAHIPLVTAAPLPAGVESTPGTAEFTPGAPAPGAPAPAPLSLDTNPRFLPPEERLRLRRLKKAMSARRSRKSKKAAESAQDERLQGLRAELAALGEVWAPSPAELGETPPGEAQRAEKRHQHQRRAESAVALSLIGLTESPVLAPSEVGADGERPDTPPPLALSEEEKLAWRRRRKAASAREGRRRKRLREAELSVEEARIRARIAELREQGGAPPGAAAAASAAAVAALPLAPAAVAGGGAAAAMAAGGAAATLAEMEEVPSCSEDDDDDDSEDGGSFKAIPSTAYPAAAASVVSGMAAVTAAAAPRPSIVGGHLGAALAEAIGGVAAIDGAAGGGIERDERRISGEVA